MKKFLYSVSLTQQYYKGLKVDHAEYLIHEKKPTHTCILPNYRYECKHHEKSQI